jgi:molybdate-binding protein
VTGKWTFPKKLVEQWIEVIAAGAVERKARTDERPFLIAAGSDDPSLLNPGKIAGYDTAVPTHFGVGLAILRGAADTGLATRTTAHLLGLDFLPLTRERFDVVVAKDRFFAKRIQVLLGIIGSREFRERVDALGGYDVTESGRIISST